MNTPPATLITIPLSHYCEKARWALDRAALPYREEAHAPLLHRLATTRNDGGSVPVLVHASQRFIDSTDILVHADAFGGGDLLYPRDPELRGEVVSLEEYFDTKLGPHVRRWAYQHILADMPLLRSLWSEQAPRRETRFVPLMAPMLRYLVRATYKITPESAQRSLVRIQEVFADVDQRLSDGRPFLTGGRFTAADLTFAALAAPAVFPAQCKAVMPTLDAAPTGMRDQVLKFRQTEAGRFALRLYSQERGCGAAVSEK